MENKKAELRKTIFEGLAKLKGGASNILNEDTATVTATDSLESVREQLADLELMQINVLDKELKSLTKKREKAESDEDFPQLRDLSKEEAKLLGKLIAAFEQKVGILKKLKVHTDKGLGDIQARGQTLFHNKNINVFNSEDYKKNATIKIQSKSNFITVKKVKDEANQWQVQASSVPGVLSADIVMLPKEIKIGGTAEMRIYRMNAANNKWEEITPATGTKIENVYQIIKNPS